MSVGLICAFGNVYIKDQKKLQRIVQTASKIIGVDRVSVAQLYNDLSLRETEQILNDSTHPLHQKFLRSSKSNGRLVGKLGPLVPTAIRL